MSEESSTGLTLILGDNTNLLPLPVQDVIMCEYMCIAVWYVELGYGWGRAGVGDRAGLGWGRAGVGDRAGLGLG